MHVADYQSFVVISSMDSQEHSDNNDYPMYDTESLDEGVTRYCIRPTLRGGFDSNYSTFRNVSGEKWKEPSCSGKTSNEPSGKTWKKFSRDTGTEPPRMMWKFPYGDGSSAFGDVDIDVVLDGDPEILQNQADELAYCFQSSEDDPQPTSVANRITQDDISKDPELFTSAFDRSRDVGVKAFHTSGCSDEALDKASGEDVSSTDMANSQDTSSAAIDNSQGVWESPSTSATDQTINQSEDTTTPDTGTTLALDSEIIPGSHYPGGEVGRNRAILRCMSGTIGW